MKSTPSETGLNDVLDHQWCVRLSTEKRFAVAPHEIRPPQTRAKGSLPTPPPQKKMLPRTPMQLGTFIWEIRSSPHYEEVFRFRCYIRFVLISTPTHCSTMFSSTLSKLINFLPCTVLWLRKKFLTLKWDL